MKKLRKRDAQLYRKQRLTQEYSGACAAKPSTTWLTLCLSVSCEINNNSEESKKHSSRHVLIRIRSESCKREPKTVVFFERQKVFSHMKEIQS